MKINLKKWPLRLMTLFAFLILGLKFDGNLSQLLQRRKDFINNIQMGGERYSLSFASLKYYIAYITEPFAFINIFGNIGLFAILAFFARISFSKNSILYSFFYCLLAGIFIELFQYITWFGAFDISDIVLRFVGILMGISIYYLYSLLQKRLLS